jgi:outer membrane receptor for ferrienterochelin and colicin
MSVFNSEALKKVEVYKSILPAEYGGRISSVIDVTMKEGNTKVRKTEHSIGLLSSTILFEGPLSYKDEDKGSYIVTGRTAYLGLVTLPLWFAYQFGNSQSYFNYLLYDINAKLNYKIDPKSRLYVSFYNSYDRWDARERYTSESRGGLNINWGNLTGTLRYNRILRPNLFFKAVVLATNYRYNIGVNTLEKIEGKFTTTEFNSLTSSLRDLTAKASVEYFKSSSHSMKVGVEATRHMYAPTGINTNFEIDQGIIEQRNRRLNANELGIFAEQDYAVQKNLTLNTGIRLNTFSVQNKAYHSFEPRLSVNWVLPQEWAIKGGFTQVRQFIHLLSTNSIGLPNDIWVPATSNVPPQFARQYSVGIFKNYPSQKTVVSLEVYYKSLKDQIDFKQGTSIFANADKPWETLIEKGGIGRAYGLELFANKTEGDFTGWFGYTLAWTKSRFDNINNGNWFYGNFDRRHTVNLTGNYKVSHRVNVSSNWTFTTGRPITVPVATIQNVDFPSRMEFLYGDRNNFRMPVYHRLDLGINWERRSYKNRAITWSIGAYNVYNRINPFYLEVVGSRVALPPGDFNFRLYSYGFIPIIPYFSYAAKF